jgi:hypothetical protein
MSPYIILMQNKVKCLPFIYNVCLTELQLQDQNKRYLTLVAAMSCCQWRSRMAGFCSSVTARREVRRFFIIASSLM